MKIGSVAWGWTPTPEDLPQGDSLERITSEVASAGFDLIDYLSTYESLDLFYTPERCRLIRDQAARTGLLVGGLVFQSDLWNNPDPAVQEKQLAYFARCVQTAVDLGAGTISCIIPGPYGAKPNRRRSPSEKMASNLPAGYSWQRDWALFVGMLSQACDLAAANHLRVAMECFPESLCSTPHAMCKLLDDVRRPNLGIQLDTAHLMNQRIDIETAIFMLGGERIYNVHAKDSDGMTRDNLPAGSGLVDYTAVFRALRYVGYAGNVSVEVEFTDNPRRYMTQALEHVRLCLAERY
ncbi:MAG: sugar phosphate isomerase/epimerase family protein [Clostridiaceae bacterium]|nr:sugar phosphate isomerase/epimerase family protein [Clostridiaceae bacterium]